MGIGMKIRGVMGPEKKNNVFHNAFATRQKWIHFKPTHLEGILDHDLLIGYSQQMRALVEKFIVVDWLSIFITELLNMIES